ncbi:MAG: ammonia-forming cytochrome c nitrite reductase subunit c552 [Candidatus Heimdallarchaeaceae archaeon]
MKRIHLIEGSLGIVLIAVVLLFLSSNVVTADQSEATYVGSDACNTCHSTQYGYWDETFHGISFFDDSEWMYNGNLTDKYIRCGDSMLPCHTVGYNQVEKGGYNPAYTWDSDENAHLLGVGCEDCHGPGSEHTSSMNSNDINQVLDQYSGSCNGLAVGECHSGSRQYGNDTIPGWSESLHSKATKEPLPEYVTGNVECSHCMSNEGSIANLEGTALTVDTEDLTWGVNCGVCHDPHPDPSNTNHYQLRASEEVICEKCHYTTSELGDEELHHPTTEMREGKAGIDVTDTTYMEDVSCVGCHMYNSAHGTAPSEYKQGHSWIPQPEACVVCHEVNGTALPVYNVTTALAEIEELQSNYATTYNTVNPNIETMKEKKEFAEEEGIWTTDLNDTYYEALWNFGLATTEGSNGTHNPDYTEALMLDANVKALGIIDTVDNTPIGTPGFELIALLAAIGIAMIILRRKKQ